MDDQAQEPSETGARDQHRIRDGLIWALAIVLGLVWTVVRPEIAHAPLPLKILAAVLGLIEIAFILAAVVAFGVKAKREVRDWLWLKRHDLRRR